MSAGRIVMIGNDMLVWNTLKFQENNSRLGYVAQEIKNC
jgi:hypothetical protein